MSTELENRPVENVAEDEPAAPAPSAQPQTDPGAAAEGPKREQRIASSAKWLYWVAALSLVNSIIVMAGGSWAFLFGLGATRFVDGIVMLAVQEDPAAALVAKGLGLGISVMIAGVYVLLGRFALQRRTWAFAVAMVLYSMDAMASLALQDFLGLAFHGWVLFSLFGGLRACYRQGQEHRGAGA